MTLECHKKDVCQAAVVSRSLGEAEQVNLPGHLRAIGPSLVMAPASACATMTETWAPWPVTASCQPAFLACQ